MHSPFLLKCVLRSMNIYTILKWSRLAVSVMTRGDIAGSLLENISTHYNNWSDLSYFYKRQHKEIIFMQQSWPSPWRSMHSLQTTNALTSPFKVGVKFCMNLYAILSWLAVLQERRISLVFEIIENIAPLLSDILGHSCLSQNSFIWSTKSKQSLALQSGKELMSSALLLFGDIVWAVGSLPSMRPMIFNFTGIVSTFQKTQFTSLRLISAL